MTVSIIIPAPLRKYVDNQKNIYCTASSVEEAFALLKEQSSTLVEHIMDPEEGVREFVRVFVNKSDIKKLQGLATPLNQGDVISIVPAFAGG